MNAIQCDNCHDILIPYDGIKRGCLCGCVEIMGIPSEAEVDWIVEVKLFNIRRYSENVHGAAKVVKINNLYLSEQVGLHEFGKTQDDLFTQNNSHIVMTDLNTPGVKVVTEWTCDEAKCAAFEKTLRDTTRNRVPAV